MISLIVTFGMVLLLFFSGRIIESVRKFIQLITDAFLKIANFCGAKISKTEKRIRVSKEFRNTFKDIQIVKKSKQNVKMKSSINLFALILFIASFLLIIINLQIVSGNVISKWLFEHNPVPKLIITQHNMDMFVTAILFSSITFALSTLINQWKETAEYRRARSDAKKKQKLLRTLSAKELLDAAKLHDNENYNRVKKIKIEDQKEEEERSLNTDNAKSE